MPPICFKDVLALLYSIWLSMSTSLIFLFAAKTCGNGIHNCTTWTVSWLPDTRLGATTTKSSWTPSSKSIKSSKRLADSEVSHLASCSFSSSYLANDSTSLYFFPCSWKTKGQSHFGLPQRHQREQRQSALESHSNWRSIIDGPNCVSLYFYFEVHLYSWVVEV